MIAIDTRDFWIPSVENDYDELVAFADTIAGIQTHEVIPIDVLDKIRAEIAEISKKYPMTMDYENWLKEALGIIDKYKAESEEV